MHAARSFDGHMKPDVSTHDTIMQGLHALLGNSTVVNTAMGELDTRSLSSSRRNHRAANNRLLIGDLDAEKQASPNKTSKKKAKKSNLFPGRDAAQHASHARSPFASLNFPSLVSPRDASFPPLDGTSSSDPIYIDSGNENNFFKRQSGHSGRTASDLVKGAMRRSLQPSATMIFSCESDEDDDKLPASTPEKKKGIKRLSYMSSNR